jgi:hypothetical protein
MACKTSDRGAGCEVVAYGRREVRERKFGLWSGCSWRVTVTGALLALPRPTLSRAYMVCRNSRHLPYAPRRLDLMVNHSPSGFPM